jgi:hypothetical protein
MNWVTLLVTLLPVVVQEIPALSAGVKQIITDIATSLGAVAASGALQGPSVSNVLLALSGVIAALRAEPNIPPAILNLIDAMDRAAQAGLAADKIAQQKVDPTLLQPITPIA